MKWIGILFIVLSLSSLSQAQQREIGVLASPLSFNELPDLALVYRHGLNHDWKVRASAAFQMDLDKEHRYDSTVLQEGIVSYQLAIGLQRYLNLPDNTDFSLYVGTDGYWNSAFNRKAHETYYGYYYSFGLKPIIGVEYLASQRIQLVLEATADFNINLQEYSVNGDTENYDRRFTFDPLSYLAFGITYTLALE